jgi:YbgC/YbaW family acyl-CoA thioester hydrolase
MPYELKFVRQVEFADTDMAGIMHFANFFRFMEAAESSFFRSLGFSIWPGASSERVGWPRVHADCDYRHPLKFEDIVEVHLLVREKRPKAIAYRFIFRKLNEQPAREVARGNIVVACVSRDQATGKMMAVPIPDSIADRIEVAPKELLDDASV